MTCPFYAFIIPKISDFVKGRFLEVVADHGGSLKGRSEIGFYMRDFCMNNRAPFDGDRNLAKILVFFNKNAYFCLFLEILRFAIMEQMSLQKHRLEDFIMHLTKETTVLAERVSYVAQRCVHYRLESENGFWIAVDGEDDSARVGLGSDLEAAWSIFCACVKGGVTPCTLEDVCCDFLYCSSCAKTL